MSTAALQQQRRVLIAYIESKKAAQDWRAVADAAMDLREIDAILNDRKIRC